MKASKIFGTVVAVALLAALILPATATFAKGPDNSLEGGNNKILITNIPVGSTIFTTIGGFPVLSSSGQPGGKFGAKLPAEAGGTIETFAPIGQTTNVYLWDGTTYRLIGVVSPSSSWPDTILDAQSASAQLAQQFGAFFNRGLASPQQGTSNQLNSQDLSNQGMVNNQNVPAQPGTLNQGLASPTTGNQGMIDNPMGLNSGQASNISGQEYVVVAGDSLSVIAKKFSVSLASLVQANNIQDQNRILVGQRLIIPSTSVQSQQNLSSNVQTPGMNQGTTTNQGSNTGSNMGSNSGSNSGGSNTGSIPY